LYDEGDGPVHNRFFCDGTVIYSMGDGVVAAVYGMSTEGYDIARRLAISGDATVVYMIDESNLSAIILNSEIARTYPNVMTLREDEPILSIEPMSTAISKADYLFFTPRVRTQAHNIRTNILSMFKDAISSLGSGASVILCTPVGMRENVENIKVMEHVTGMTVGKQVHYYYYPLESGRAAPSVIGSHEAEEDARLHKILDPDESKKFVNLLTSEYLYALTILSRFTGTLSILEVGKFVSDGTTRAEMSLDERVQGLYLADMISGLLDIRILESSLEAERSLRHLALTCIRTLDLYLKFLAADVKRAMRACEIRANRSIVTVMWSFDSNLMRGDNHEICSLLVKRLHDYMPHVEMYNAIHDDTFKLERASVVIPCSQNDLRVAEEVRKEITGLLVVKANSIYEKLTYEDP